MPVTVTLLKSRLITVGDEDQQLAKLIYSSPRPNLQDFASGLLRECLTSEPPIATQQQFTLTVAALTALVQSGKANER